MVLDAAQVRTMDKSIRDPSYMDDLWKDDRSGRCIEEGSKWNNFDDVYLTDNMYMLVLTAIMRKAGRIREEGNKRIS